jgi:hypothetical protein
MDYVKLKGNQQMAQISYRANLSAAIFPMTLARSGRSVIVPGPDQNFNRSIDAPDDSNRDAGIPQIIYGENVLPTADGYQSVGYKLETPLPPNPFEVVKDLTVSVPVAGTVREINLQIGAAGVYWYQGFWSAVTLVGAWAYGSGNDVTTATIRGVCYLYTGNQLYKVENLGNLTITNITATVTPVGFLTDKVSMCGAYNYLLFASKDTFYWSSTTTPTDFVPSLISGAGSGAINGAAGNVKYLRTTTFGCFVYCEANVVATSYTGNSRYPWRLIPVSQSEGAASHRQIASSGLDSFNFFINNKGTLQQLDSNNANLLGQEVSELFERLKYYDVFDYATNTFTVVAQPLLLSNFKLTYLGNRFLLISLKRTSGPNYYEEVIVYDVYFKRYGKFNLPHTSIIEVTGFSDDLYKILFINSISGINYELIQNVNDASITMQGVLVLGKFQYVRSRFLCLDEVSAESGQLSSLVPPESRNFEAYAIPSLDGKTFLTAQVLFEREEYTTGAVQTYNSSAEGKNVSLLFKGAFDLCSVEMTFHVGGKF